MLEVPLALTVSRKDAVSIFLRFRENLCQRPRVSMDVPHDVGGLSVGEVHLSQSPPIPTAVVHVQIGPLLDFFHLTGSLPHQKFQIGDRSGVHPPSLGVVSVHLACRFGGGVPVKSKVFLDLKASTKLKLN